MARQHGGLPDFGAVSRESRSFGRSDARADFEQTSADHNEVYRRAVTKLREGTEVLRTGGGTLLSTAECNALLERLEWDAN